jgi:hypothetical protein
MSPGEHAMASQGMVNVDWLTRLADIAIISVKVT